MLKVPNLALPVEEPEESVPRILAKQIGCAPGDLPRWRIVRKSLDARQRSNLRFVYTAVVEAPEEFRVSQRGAVQAFEPPQFDDPDPGQEPTDDRPLIVGSGPAGLLAGYYLARKGYRPLIIERGRPVKERVAAIRAFDGGGEFEPENNYLFGEGGAGAFSDGKLTCRVTGADVDYVLERFVECGGRESLTYEHRPHLGSNKLPMICRNFRRKIEALGGEYRFDTTLEGLDIVDGRVRGAMTSGGYVKTNQLLLGIGHSARDTYEMLLAAGVPLLPKAFQLGLRIEQPQEIVNKHKYGRESYLDILGAADYSLVANGRRDLYTFCMCAGGWIIPSVSEPRRFCTNGMSNSRHDTEWANSGLVVTLEPHEFGASHPLAGVELQRQYEAAAFELAGRNYQVPVQRADDFVNSRAPATGSPIDCSYRRGSTPLELSQVLPPVIANAVRAGLPVMDEKWRGQFLKDAVLVGPEMRGSSPVRIDRDRRSRVCPDIDGLYPIGEGAGYAGGIVTAAVDGLRSAREVVRRFAPVG
ncbi:NAD(P)/FAD-dependent oxidoreductase [Stratiformator vulcanicus]|uniref:D-amino acid dehydrogenase small subunit n=1 Tax=Stratiformator vulcanicus TaxID=2527980 RepID=A0A517R4G7_9PLAN|nr:NAD(P)-binding protein [Stratiformator vulcanicus]QDT38766.1 D-amino acid dehydrogenase small subunit [Stratiformator vulcanicus]